MTDIELVAKKLAFIETCVRELKDLARPQLIATDVREVVEHRLADLLAFVEAIRRRLM